MGILVAIRLGFLWASFCDSLAINVTAQQEKYRSSGCYWSKILLGSYVLVPLAFWLNFMSDILLFFIITEGACT